MNIIESFEAEKSKHVDATSCMAEVGQEVIDYALEGEFKVGDRELLALFGFLFIKLATRATKMRA